MEAIEERKVQKLVGLKELERKSKVEGKETTRENLVLMNTLSTPKLDIIPLNM